MHSSFSVITGKRSTRSFELAGSALFCAILVGACGGGLSEAAPVQHRAGPAGFAYSPTFTPRDLVYERRGGARVAVRRPPNIDAYLVASERRPSRRPARAAVASQRPTAESASPTPAPVAVALASAAPSAGLQQPASEDLQRYAARERDASKQMQYRGGDVIVIGASTLIVVLLVVILVLLLVH